MPQAQPRPPADIPFPLSSAPGEYPGEGAGRIINGYAEPLGPTAASPAAWKRVPGLKAFATAAGVGCRGFLEVNGVVFAVIGTQLVYVDSAGAVTVVGNVAGTQKVFMARNNKKPTPDKVLVTENGAFVFTTVPSIVVYPDPNLPQPCGVTSQDGYFIFPIADGRVFGSNLNDTPVNALNFATAESKPDGLIRAVPFNNQILLFGAYSCEFWIDTANPPPAFPYSRSTSESRGLASATAIAGHEDGFGAVALMWVADHNRVVKLNGYKAEDVSPPDLDRLIEAITDKTTLEACVYVSNGVPRWVLSSPTWTWECNLNTMRWNERQSQGLFRWAATQGVYAFGKWLVGDTRTGNIYVVDRATRKEGANPLRFRLESGEVSNFPNRMRVARADFDMATGVGDAASLNPNEGKPVAEFSYSDDGGSTWSLPQQEPLGERGQFKTRITLTRQGQSGPRGRRWRIDVSDPVYVGFVKGTQFATPRKG